MEGEPNSYALNCDHWIKTEPGVIIQETSPSTNIIYMYHRNKYKAGANKRSQNPVFAMVLMILKK